MRGTDWTKARNFGIEDRNNIEEYSFKERGGFRTSLFIVKILYLPFSSGLKTAFENEYSYNKFR